MPCTKCKKTFDLKWLKTEIFNPETNEGVPKCPECGGVVRPDVVLFGEALPERFWSNISADFEAWVNILPGTPYLHSIGIL